MSDQFPGAEASPSGRDHHSRSSGSFRRRLCSTHHTDIGTLYLCLSVVSGIVGALFSVLMRFELQAPGLQLFPDGQTWNLVMTAHGLIMVFFMVMPALIGGFGNWLVPTMIGASGMAFPRLNMLGFWLMIPSLALLLGSTLVGMNTGEGRTEGLPLPGTARAPGLSLDLAILALLLAGTSLVTGAINFIATIFNMRAPGMTFHKLPLFVWAVLVTAFLLVLTVPVLAGAITLLVMGGTPGGALFQSGSGGDPLLFQRVLWFFGHPEAYIMIVPSFGIVSHIIATFARRPVVGYLGMVYAMCAIGLIGFVVWAQQMYTSGMSFKTDSYFGIAILIISIPTAIILLSWIATMWRRAPALKTPMLYAIGFMVIFIFGGAAGAIMRSGSPDVSVHATYFVVAHFHLVLSLGAVFAALGGWYYWIGAMSGRQYPELWGKIQFWTMFVGVNLTMIPQYVLGLDGMPRHTPDYPDSFAGLNFISSIGAYTGFASGMIFCGIALYTLIKGSRVGDDYWGERADARS